MVTYPDGSVVFMSAADFEALFEPVILRTRINIPVEDIHCVLQVVSLADMGISVGTVIQQTGLSPDSVKYILTKKLRGQVVRVGKGKGALWFPVFR